MIRSRARPRFIPSALYQQSQTHATGCAADRPRPACARRCTFGQQTQMPSTGGPAQSPQWLAGTGAGGSRCPRFRVAAACGGRRLSSLRAESPIPARKRGWLAQTALPRKKSLEKCVKSVHFLAPFPLVFTSFRSVRFRLGWFRAVRCRGPARWRLRVACIAGHGSGGMGQPTHAAWDACLVDSCCRGGPCWRFNPSPRTRGPGHSENRRG